jgi:hypothetical protein
MVDWVKQLFRTFFSVRKTPALQPAPITTVRRYHRLR